jgi:carbon-monoxide dehydrogenase medium subunit
MNGVGAFHQPSTVDEAVTLLAGSPDAVPLAGGTDLGVQIRRGKVRPTALVALHKIDDLHRLAVAGDEVVIGSGVTHRRIERSAIFDGALVALREACETVGAVQTRTVGTIGGNLANASPAADTAPVLLAFGATVDISGPTGNRNVGVDQFFLGYRRTALSTGDIITAVRCPVSTTDAGSAFLKLGRRRAMEISISCAAAFVQLGEDGETCTAAGIGLGSVSPTAIRATAAEAVLIGNPVTDELLRAAAGVAATHCSPVDDIRATAAYRRQVTRVLVHRVLRLALDRAQTRGKGTPQ